MPREAAPRPENSPSKADLILRETTRGAPPAETSEAAPVQAASTPVLRIPSKGATPSELAYTNRLFDFTSLRRSW